MNLWVDDERTAPGSTDVLWVRALTSRTAIALLDLNEFDEVSLDHDLGGEDTGMIVLDWMVEKTVWPKKILTIHTANPPAREAMLRTANRYAPGWVDIYVLYR